MNTTSDTRRPTPPDLCKLERELRNIGDERLSERDKGVPSGLSLTLGEVGQPHWNVCAGDLPLPSMVLKRAALEHNIELMQAYCDRHGAWFAPHGKTTMAPQIFAEQLRAGAWAITVANIAQLQVCRSFGIPRVLFANEPVSAHEIRYIVQQLESDPDFDLYALVDSVEGVDRLAQQVKAAGGQRKLAVLVELGLPCGRCGARTLPELMAVADTVLSHEDELQLAGVEGFEGIVTRQTPEERVAAVDHYLDLLATAVRMLVGRVAHVPFLVSAGGSEYFDRVVARLGHHVLPQAQLVLRSGGYVTHDSGILDQRSPFGTASERRIPGERLQPALEVWAAVLSRPEPDLAIVGMGRRDVPTDAGLPVPLLHAAVGSIPQSVQGAFSFFAMNDQHAYLRVPVGTPVKPGDLIGSGISHPCTAFDRWRTLFVVDEQRTVVGAVRTFF